MNAHTAIALLIEKYPTSYITVAAELASHHHAGEARDPHKTEIKVYISALNRQFTGNTLEEVVNTAIAAPTQADSIAEASAVITSIEEDHIPNIIPASAPPEDVDLSTPEGTDMDEKIAR